MKVRIAYTVTVDDSYRRAINFHYGMPGLATRQQVLWWIRAHGSAEDDNLTWDLQQAVERGEEKEL